MCYSKEASRNIFIFNVITSYALFTYNSTNVTHKILALFLGFVGIMQFFDWILWSNQNLDDKYQAYNNYLFTKFAMIFNHLQPIILGYLFYIYKGDITVTSKYFLYLYTIVILIYSLNAFNIKYTQLSIDKKPTLEWKWNSQQYSAITYTIYLITLCILAYENLMYPINILFTFIVLFTFFFSKYNYKSIYIGRFWCKFAGYIPLLLIVLGKFNLIDI